MNPNDAKVLFSTRTVAEIIRPEAAAVLYQIDQQVLEHGRDWKMQPHGMVYTSDGLSRICEELRSRGQPAAANRLHEALMNALIAARAEGPDAAIAAIGALVHVDHIEANESELEKAANAHRRYRREEVSPFPVDSDPT